MSHDLLRVHPFVPEQLVLHVTVDCRQNVTSLFLPKLGWPNQAPRSSRSSPAMLP